MTLSSHGYATELYTCGVFYTFNLRLRAVRRRCSSAPIFQRPTCTNIDQHKTLILALCVRGQRRRKNCALDATITPQPPPHRAAEHLLLVSPEGPRPETTRSSSLSGAARIAEGASVLRFAGALGGQS